jgi:AcrR family transcriptional regulator
MAAVEIVVREAGIERATVRAIAARAGVAVGTLYRRFPNKRALVLAVQRRFLARRTERAALALRIARSHQRPVEAALAGFVNGAILVIERDRRLLQAFATESSSDSAIHAALMESIDHLSGQRVRSRLWVDVILLALRALILDGKRPSGAPRVRRALVGYLPALVRT